LKKVVCQGYIEDSAEKKFVALPYRLVSLKLIDAPYPSISVGFVEVPAVQTIMVP